MDAEAYPSVSWRRKPHTFHNIPSYSCKGPYGWRESPQFGPRLGPNELYGLTGCFQTTSETKHHSSNYQKLFDGQAELSMLILAESRQARSEKMWLVGVLVRSKNIQFDPKWVESPQFGLRLGPNELYGLTGRKQTTSVACSGSANACSALATEPKPFKARG